MNRGTTMRSRFRAASFGQRGGMSPRWGIDHASADLSHDDEKTGISMVGYLSPENLPCVRIETKNDGKVRVLWDGPLSMLWTARRFDYEPEKMTNRSQVDQHLDLMRARRNPSDIRDARRHRS